MKRYNELSKIINTVLVFSNTEKLSLKQKESLNDLMDIGKTIISEGVGVHDEVKNEVVDE